MHDIASCIEKKNNDEELINKVQNMDKSAVKRNDSTVTFSLYNLLTNLA